MKLSQITFPDTYQVVEKTIRECVEFNKANKEYIELGMVIGQRPDPRELAKLQLEEARKEGAVALVKQLVPGCKVEKSDGYDTWYTTIDNVNVRLKREGIGYGYSSRRHVWRVYFEAEQAPGYRRSDGKRFVLVGDGDNLGATLKQLEKCRKVMTEVIAWQKQAAADRAEQNTAAKRKIVFFKANKALLEQLGITDYDRKFSLYEDLRFSYDMMGPYTVSQWQAVAVLRAQHAEAMKTLVDSFKS